MRRSMRVGAWAVALAAQVACSGGGGGGGGAIVEPEVVLTSCDPVAQTGCSTGKKCTWVRSSASAGALGCVPAGTVARGGGCRYADGGVASGTGYDDCAKGLVCLGGADAGQVGTCAAICDANDVASCTPSDTWSCATYTGVFQSGEAAAIAGVCDPQCDPVTQVRLSDGAAACGSPDSSSPAFGCYGAPGRTQPSRFLCAPAGDAAMTEGAVLDLPIYLNSCAPGYAPLLRESTASSAVVCSAFCEPVDTTLAAHAAPGGLAPHDCQSAGGTATSECRYWWWMESAETPPSIWSNAIGACFDHARYQYDADRDGTPETPVPSCTTLSSTAFNFDPVVSDAEYWGCVAR